jgi:hypothetical protein
MHIIGDRKGFRVSVSLQHGSQEHGASSARGDLRRIVSRIAL